jgi:predicted Zn-dependent protease with MMP-like domain
MPKVIRQIPTHAPSLEDIGQLAEAAHAALPPVLRRHAEDVIIRVEDFPSDDICEEMELESPFDILGLYQGVDLPSRSVHDIGRLPDLVFLYRRPILDYWCESGERLSDIVRHVLIHEVGHHFGFSDEAMELLEHGAETEN